MWEGVSVCLSKTAKTRQIGTCPRRSVDACAIPHLSALVTFPWDPFEPLSLFPLFFPYFFQVFRLNGAKKYIKTNKIDANIDVVDLWSDATTAAPPSAPRPTGGGGRPLSCLRERVCLCVCVWKCVCVWECACVGV